MLRGLICRLFGEPDVFNRDFDRPDFFSADGCFSTLYSAHSSGVNGPPIMQPISLYRIFLVSLIINTRILFRLSNRNALLQVNQIPASATF